MIKFPMISTTPFTPAFDLIINSPLTITGMASTMIFGASQSEIYVGGHLIDSGNSDRHLSIFKIGNTGTILGYFGYTVVNGNYY
jgi:hypothetical protein